MISSRIYSYFILEEYDNIIVVQDLDRQDICSIEKDNKLHDKLQALHHAYKMGIKNGYERKCKEIRTKLEV